MKPDRISFAALILAAACAHAGPQSVVLTPIQDTTVHSGNPSESYEEDNLVVGEFDGEWRALIQWDIAGAIPPGSTICSVEIRLEQGCFSETSGIFLAIDRVIDEWDEDDSWNDDIGGATLSDGIPIAACSFGSPYITFGSTPAFVQWVQGVVGGQADYGLRFRASPPVTGAYQVFGSSEVNDPPQLVIEYEIGETEPDLAATSIDLASGPFKPGDDVIAGVDVSNLGSGDADGFAIAFLASTGPGGTGQPYSLGPNMPVGGLAAGASQTYSLTLGLPAGLPEGDYFIGAEIRDIDPADADSSNHEVWSSGAVDIARPDLGVVSLTVDPQSVAPGDAFGIDAQIENDAVIESTDFMLYVTIGSDGDLLHSESLSGLSAGGTTDWSAQVMLPGTIGPGDIDICVTVVEPCDTRTGNDQACAALTVEPLTPLCPADCSGDGLVNFDDLNLLLDDWGESVASGEGCDFSGNGTIDFDDLNLLLDEWGDDCN